MIFIQILFYLIIYIFYVAITLSTSSITISRLDTILISWSSRSSRENRNYISNYNKVWTSLVSQMAKTSAYMWETRVRSLNWEDSLEKEMATHSSTLAWKSPWMEEPGGPWGHKESDTTEQLHFHFHGIYLCSPWGCKE